jgi:hypothetical protein
MSDSAMVVSSDEITTNELSDFVLSLGGGVIPGETESFWISDQEADLWLAIQSRSFALEFYDEETLEAWRRSLGSDVKTIIELRLDHTPLCKMLYLYVACKLGERWNVVLDDVDDSVVCYDDILSMYRVNSRGLAIDKSK